MRVGEYSARARASEVGETKKLSSFNFITRVCTHLREVEEEAEEERTGEQTLFFAGSRALELE